MKKGFTLLELLIVVVIIGVLALIAAPTLLNATDRAKDGTVRANTSAAASSVNSRFALDSGNTASQIASSVATQLNGDNENPVNSANPAFTDTAGAQAGAVTIVGDDANDEITITGYGVDSTAIITKVVSSPQDME